jgi:(2Fe-2S) ferredoxin
MGPVRFRHHVFVCENRRPGDDPRGSCACKGSVEVRAALKAELKRRGLKDVRANAAGCLDACAFGPSVVVYPEGVWYGGVTVADVPEIVEQHLVGGRPVERLVLRQFTGEAPGASEQAGREDPPYAARGAKEPPP